MTQESKQLHVIATVKYTMFNGTETLTVVDFEDNGKSITGNYSGARYGGTSFSTALDNNDYSELLNFAQYLNSLTGHVATFTVNDNRPMIGACVSEYDPRFYSMRKEYYRGHGHNVYEKSSR